jgi:signal transduction histidine kinase
MRKKILFIFVLVLTIHHSFFAQNDLLKELHKIDDIKSDSIAINRLETISNKGNLTTKQQLEVNLRLLMRLYFSQQFEKAFSIGNIGLTLAKRNHLDSMEGAFNKHLGNTYYYMDVRKKAEEYFRVAYTIAHSHNLWQLEASCANNLGGVLTDFKKFEEAEFYLQRSISIMKDHSRNDANLYLSYRVLGALYMETKQLDKAENVFKELIEKLNYLKDTNLICSNLIYYSTLLKKKGDTVNAVIMSEKALNLLRKKNNFHALISGLRTHAANLAAAKRFNEAYTLDSEAFTLLKKSYNDDIEKQISETEVKYKTAQIQLEKENVEIQTKKERLFFISSTLFLFIILISVFLIYSQRKNNKHRIAFQKQRLESLIEGEEKEKSRIAKDLHDGIVQDLTAIKLKMEGLDPGNTSLHKIIHEIDDAAKEIRDIAHQMMPVSLREYGLASSLEDLLQKTLVIRNIKFDFELVNIETRLPEKIEICLYRVTQELLNNVMKHSKASFVSLVVSKHQDSVSLILEDNGTGFNFNDVKKGIGMTSLSSRLEIVKGELKFETSPGAGTMVIIKIPLNIQ